MSADPIWSLMLTSFIGRSLSIRRIFAALSILRLRKLAVAAVDADAWSRASYHPTPTIIEAARALYAQHSVEAIARLTRVRRICHHVTAH